MAQHYSPRDFLRRAPNALLARYFHERDLLLDVNIADLGETDVEPMFEEWQQLPPEQRAQVDSDFTTVDVVTDEEGIRTILDEARFHGEELEPIFADMEGFHDKALWTFLQHQTFVDISARFIDADRLPGNYWIRRREGVPTVQPRDDQLGREDLARAISAYFRQKEGRGYACVVEAYRRGPSFYFFAYPEDYGRTEIEFEGGQFQRRPRRPAFEVVFVYSSDGAPSTPSTGANVRLWPNFKKCSRELF